MLSIMTSLKFCHMLKKGRLPIFCMEAAALFYVDLSKINLTPNCKILDWSNLTGFEDRKK